VITIFDTYNYFCFIENIDKNKLSLNAFAQYFYSAYTELRNIELTKTVLRLKGSKTTTRCIEHIYISIDKEAIECKVNILIPKHTVSEISSKPVSAKVEYKEKMNNLKENLPNSPAPKLASAPTTNEILTMSEPLLLDSNINKQVDMETLVYTWLSIHCEYKPNQNIETNLPLLMKHFIKTTAPSFTIDATFRKNFVKKLKIAGNKLWINSNFTREDTKKQGNTAFIRNLILKNNNI
jgi:hypothetical protein